MHFANGVLPSIPDGDVLPGAEAHLPDSADPAPSKAARPGGLPSIQAEVAGAVVAKQKDKTGWNGHINNLNEFMGIEECPKEQWDGLSFGLY